MDLTRIRNCFSTSDKFNEVQLVRLYLARNHFERFRGQYPIREKMYLGGPTAGDHVMDPMRSPSLTLPPTLGSLAEGIHFGGEHQSLLACQSPNRVHRE